MLTSSIVDITVYRRNPTVDSGDHAQLVVDDIRRDIRRAGLRTRRLSDGCRRRPVNYRWQVFIYIGNETGHNASSTVVG